jgi:hypothetical protein
VRATLREIDKGAVNDAGNARRAEESRDGGRLEKDTGVAAHAPDLDVRHCRAPADDQCPWGFKAPNSMYALPLYAAAFARSRKLSKFVFVHVVRDGRDIMVSDNTVTSTRFLSRLRPELRDERGLIEACARAVEAEVAAGARVASDAGSRAWCRGMIRSGGYLLGGSAVRRAGDEIAAPLSGWAAKKRRIASYRRTQLQKALNWSDVNAAARACARALDPTIASYRTIRLEDLLDPSAAVGPVQAVLQAAGITVPDTTVRAAAEATFSKDLGSATRLRPKVVGGAPGASSAPSSEEMADAVAARYGKWRGVRDRDPLWFAVLQRIAADTLEMFEYKVEPLEGDNLGPG